MKLSIRSKILVSVFSLVILGIIGIFVLSQTVLVNSYLELEHEAMHVNLERVSLALDDELTKMGVINRDWAVWDDTYGFIQDANQDFIDANMDDDTLINLGLNLMLFIRNDGEVVYAKAVDLIAGSEMPLPEGIEQYFQFGSHILQHPAPDHLYREIITVHGGTYFILSGPVLPTSGAGEIVGSLVLGRLITEEFIGNIADITRIPFTVWEYSGATLPEDVNDAKTELVSEDHFIKPKDNQILAGYITIRDFNGQPALIARVEMPRDIYLQGLTTVKFFLTAAVLASIVMGIIIYWMMGRLVVNRLSVLSSQVQTAGQTGVFPQGRMDLKDDEISLLSGEMANTFHKLKTINEELSESEERYKVLVSLGTESGEAIVMLRDTVDLEGGQVFVSDSWARLTGYTADELLGMSFFSLVSPENRADSLARHRLKMQGREMPGFFLMTIQRKDGAEIPIELTSSITTYQGQSVNVMYIRDITERKQMEETLRREEEQLERLLNDTLEIIQSVAPNGKYVFVNQAWHDLLGYTAEDLTKLTLFDVIHPDSLGHCQALFNQILAGQAKSNVSVGFLTKDGRVVNVEGNIVPRIEEGRVTATHGFFRDVTERNKIEQARRESERMYATLVDNLPGLVYRCANDRNWTMLFISDGCFQITGYHPEDFINNKRLPFSDIIQADYQEEIVRQWQDVLSRREAFEKEYPITTASGDTRWVWERGQGVFSDTGELLFLEGFITDITERRNAEAKEKQLRDKAEMSSRLAAVGEMAAGIAHEINNPLTGVIGFSEMLMSTEGLPDEVQENLKIINDGSQRVKEIIRRMLIFAQQSKPTGQLSDLHELLENTLELRSYVLRTANIEVVREYAPDLPLVTVDPGQLQQVFLNLIVNAEYSMKKAHGRGRLTIKTELANEMIKITVEDDGGGIPPEVKTKLFQPFYTTKEPGEGTGLGLSLSRGIILEHGGVIEETGAAGVGARFVITLPVAAGQTAESANGQTGETTHDNVTLRDLRVLVVDDEANVRAFVKALLSNRGNTVDEAGFYRDALELLANHDYDVVLLDIRMPGTSGIELYREISARHPRLARRVIFITGDISDPEVKKYLEQRKLLWVTKPFDRAILERRVWEMLEDAKAGADSPVENENVINSE